MTAVRRPAFLPTSRGDLFTLDFCPAGNGAPADLTVVVVPAFAEEMNRSRRCCVLLAERLATAGCRTILFDFSGTGDSHGDFAAARLQDWRADLLEVAAHSRATGAQRLVLLGVRFGALLAAETAVAADAEALVLWQPAPEGAVVVSQFRRLAAAAKLVGKKSDTAATEAETASLPEIAGYSFSQSLADDLAELHLSQSLAACQQRSAWFEMTTRAEQGLSPAAVRVLKSLAATRSTGIVERSIVGPAFWSTTEITTSDALIAATVEFVVDAPHQVTGSHAHG